MTDHQVQKGMQDPITWMVHNRITSNLLMIVLMVGGFYMTTQITREVFPEFELDVITVSVSYPGASPAEVEQGIVLAIEEAVRAIEGIEEITAMANEGVARILLELDANADPKKTYQDVQQQIDRIRTFPEDAEEPQVSLDVRRRGVLVIQIYGDISEWVLRDLAEQVRDKLLQNPEISQVDLRGARNYEIHLEISQDKLRAYGLTLEGIARTVADTAVEIPGGTVKTDSGEILLRMMERRDWADEFADIPIVSTAQGTVLYLRDFAQIRDGFIDTNRSASYNGYPSIGLDIYRVGEQTPIGISETVRNMMEQIRADLPPGINLTINRDSSEIYQQRLQLLLKNAFIGLCLVLLLLSLFLEFSLAFWVVMGIATSFLGALLFLPLFDVTINMVSMFAFIIALGIVVDDAIIAGENIYEYRQRGMGLIEAASRGAKDIALPVSFAIFTNMIAFLPLLVVPGTLGKIWFVIPAVVLTVFVISWVEALFILPAHLAYAQTVPKTSFTHYLHAQQLKFSRFFLRCIDTYYGPFLRKCFHVRYFTLAVGIATLAIVIAYALSGRMGIELMPKVESNRAIATAVLPYGSSLQNVTTIRDILITKANELAEENGGENLVRGIFADIEENQVEVTLYLTPPRTRPIGTAQVTSIWREKVGQLSGLESLRFESDRGGPGGGPQVTVELRHRDINILERAGEDLAERLSEFDSVKDTDDGYARGKEQLDFKLKEEGRSLGLTTHEVARQVRNSFYGAEALRQQRGRNEVKVMVRLPESERIREYDIEHLLIRTPAGRDVPLMQIAEVDRGRAYSVITRRDGQRTINVTAEVEPAGESNRVLATVKEDILPELVNDYSGLSYSFEGRQADFREALQSLAVNYIFALIATYMLLAILFGSYIQPVIVMSAIPFGIIGAVIGHFLMGYGLSLVSVMGIVALSGVVVNDSLVMIDYANRLRKSGSSAIEAIHAAGIRRFRPILLTTLTTFGGLAPMIFETSRQARFMIPMAISLGYGILFATLIILIIVPCLYLITEDIVEIFRIQSRSADVSTQ